MKDQAMSSLSSPHKVPRLFDPAAAPMIAIAGSVSLAVAMGIGRFAFTPILPMMLGEGTLDPGKVFVVERCEVDAHGLGAEGLTQGAEFRLRGHRRSPLLC